MKYFLCLINLHVCHEVYFVQRLLYPVCKKEDKQAETRFQQFLSVAVIGDK